MIEKIKSIAMSIYIGFALFGWLIVLVAWENPSQGFKIVAAISSWVALVCLGALLAGIILRGLDKLANR